jgi:hypothetical protein
MNAVAFGSVMLAAGLASGQPATSAADRTSIRNSLADSVVVAVDQNGDCDVTDVDYALLVEARLTSLYGVNLAVGDLDGNGGVNAEDVVFAIKSIVRASYGKTLSASGPVTLDDVEITIINVANESVEGDINLDGEADVLDTISAIGQVGVSLSPVDLDRVSRELFTYVGVIRERGRAAMMVIACKPKNHLEGVSNTWPADHPSWWPENHLTGVSKSYDENRPGHLTAASTATPTPPPHEQNLSKSWPANHLASSSDTWDKPYVIPTFPWQDPLYPEPHHATSTSTTWPSGHTKEASTTWPSSHDQNTSRTWWPHHTATDSNSLTVPPMHISAVSQTWSHDTTLSRSIWPSNHYPSVSNGWGPSHQLNVSAALPPAHLNYASNGWPGPQPSWPPSHTVTVSTSWGEPAPGGWPVLPPDHNWLSTYERIVQPLVPRLPWAP